MKSILRNESGSALMMISVIIVIVGIFSLNISRMSTQTLNLQSNERIDIDRKQIERYLRTVLSNEDLCKALVKVDRNNQVRINGFEFRSGKVEAFGFQLMNSRYVFGNTKLAEFVYDTRCPKMSPQKRACASPGNIPLLYAQDNDGNLTVCQYGSGPNHCRSLGGEWVESSKTCDLCLGIGGSWKDGSCYFY